MIKNRFGKEEPRYDMFFHADSTPYTNGKETQPLHVLADKFNEELDDIYGCVEICGETYNQADVWRVITPLDYMYAFQDWLDSAGWEDVDDVCRAA